MKATNQTNTEPTFTRRKKVGLNFMELEEGETCFVEIQKQDTFTSKNYPDGIDYFDVVDLKTGEEKRMWIDGGLRGTLSNIGGITAAVGMKLEIKKGNQKQIEIVNDKGQTEKVKTNTYEIWAID